MAIAHRRGEDTTWADINGRWFFAWRMAAACEIALREVHGAMTRQTDVNRMEALQKASELFRQEMQRWLQEAEEMDAVVKGFPAPPQAFSP